MDRTTCVICIVMKYAAVFALGVVAGIAYTVRM